MNSALQAIYFLNSHTQKIRCICHSRITFWRLQTAALHRPRRIMLSIIQLDGQNSHGG